MEFELSDTSSELSSLPSTPPSEDSLYPSPPESQACQAQPAAASKAAGTVESAPVRKKRKIEPKPRITRHLDLTYPDKQVCPGQEEQLKLLLRTLREHRKIVVVAGAGISVSAGSKFSL